MAASSSKPTLVHFSLVFFILTTAVFGLLYYVAEGGRQTAVKKSEEDTAKANTLTTNLNQANDDMQQCLTWLFGKTGAPATFKNGNPQDPTTVAGKVNQEHFGRFGQGVAEASYDAILRKLEETVRLTRDELTKRNEEFAREHKIVQELEAKYNGQVASEKDARSKAEKDVQDQTRTKEEVVAQLEKDKADLKDAYTAIEIQAQNDKLAWEKEKKGLVDRLNNLQVTNTRLREDLDKTRQTSFEIPTAFVRYVDTTNRLVYIDLGSADKLPLRMTFSVYAKSHSGVGRGKEDIKGSIEVTQIIDAHTSVCRVNQEDIHNPITSGDPIFTPIWTPG